MEAFILPVEIVNSRDWLAIIISALIPILVMAITLFFSHREQRRALKQQADTFEISLKEQKETTRLSIMPVFDVVKVTSRLELMPVLSAQPQTSFLIDISLKNAGNNTAINPYTKWTSVKNDCAWFPVYENEYAYYTCYKDAQCDRLVVAVQDEIEITLNRQCVKAETPASEEVLLPLRFCDLLGNEYEQRIVIRLFADVENGDMVLFELKSHIPELLIPDKEDV